MPLLAVSMRRVDDRRHHERRDGISHDVIGWLTGLGFDPFLVPNSIRGAASLVDRANCDGLVLTGGDTIGDFPDRDGVETELVAWALARRRPVLGICRGLQFLNRYFGGAVTDLRTLGGAEGAHARTVHEVEILDSMMAQQLRTRAIRVNSYHEWAVLEDQVAAPLMPWARHGRVIEGLVHEAAPIVAVQWHPERSGNDPPWGQQIVERWFSTSALTRDGRPAVT